jgi:hypothetical protein
MSFLFCQGVLHIQHNFNMSCKASPQVPRIQQQRRQTGSSAIHSLEELGFADFFLNTGILSLTALLPQKK